MIGVHFLGGGILDSLSLACALGVSFHDENMTCYQVMLEGKDFLIELDGIEGSVGFVTTRWVRASNKEEAELKAVDLIQKDSEFVNTVSDRQDVNPVIYPLQIAKVNWFTYIRRQPGAGYGFYKQ